MVLWEITRSLGLPPPFHFSTLHHPPLSHVLSPKSLISGMLPWKPLLAGVWSRDVGSQSWRSMPLTHKNLSLVILCSPLSTLDVELGSQHIMYEKHCSFNINWITLSDECILRLKDMPQFVPDVWQISGPFLKFCSYLACQQTPWLHKTVTSVCQLFIQACH
jgi:hypothetical protein